MKKQFLLLLIFCLFAGINVYADNTSSGSVAATETSSEDEEVEAMKDELCDMILNMMFYLGKLDERLTQKATYDEAPELYNQLDKIKPMLVWVFQCIRHATTSEEMKEYISYLNELNLYMKEAEIAIDALNSIEPEPLTATTVEGVVMTFSVISEEDKTSRVGTGDAEKPAIPLGTTGTVTIPATVDEYTVTAIGNYAFYRCSNLVTVTIGDGIRSIGKNAFSGCNSLKEIHCYAAEPPIVDESVFDNVDVRKVQLVVPDESYNAYRDHEIWGQFWINKESAITVTTVEGVTMAFYVLSEEDKTVQVGLGYYRKPAIPSSTTGTVTIPAKVGDYTVTTIGVCAFSDCYRLSSVNIPESVTVIDDLAFWYCHDLTSINIPKSVKTIGSQAFDNSGLTSIIIPKTVESIGSDNPFAGCRNLTSIKVEEGNANYDSRNNCNAVIETATNKLIGGGKNTVIPEGVTCIGNLAFYFCDGLTSITIPESVTTLEPYAFCACSGLKAINIPSSVTYIGRMSFYHCRSFTSITIPYGVTNIYDSTFEGCNNLATVTIGKGMKTIEYGAFKDCTGLKEIYCLANKTPEVVQESFDGVDVSNVMLVVPDESYEAYKAHKIWGQFCIETPTSATSPLMKTEEGASIYSVSGLQLNKPQKGIYIKGGKKILVK